MKTTRLISKKKQERDNLDRQIAERFAALTSDPNNMIFEVMKTVAEEFKVGFSRIYRVRKTYRMNRRTIDRERLYRHYSMLVKKGTADAAQKTADEFGCTTSYVYHINKIVSHGQRINS